jgi:hypothetical protein
MPTVFIIRNIRVVIYPNDHPPPHVHAVKRNGAFAKFELNCPNGPVILISQKEFKPAVVNKIGNKITQELLEACTRWSYIHG